jgi:hypothetical protein
MRRGGQHGVINWICSQIKPSLHINDCSLQDGDLICMAPYKYIKGEKKRIQMDPTEMIYPDDYSVCLFNFEDQPITETLETFLEWSERVLPFEFVTKIVLVRDPLNLFASRSKDERIKMGIDKAKTLYKSHLKMAMNSPSCLGINFNKWFLDEKYRKALAARLNIPFTDEGLNDIIWPGKSTFDGLRFDGRAQEMKILERWKELDSNFLGRIMDQELREYAKDYFHISEE